MAILTPVASPQERRHPYVRRLIIVRQGATEVYEQLQRRYDGDAETVLIYDRRLPLTVCPFAREHRRRSGEARIIETRGFYVLRRRPGRDGTPTSPPTAE